MSVLSTLLDNWETRLVSALAANTDACDVELAGVRDLDATGLMTLTIFDAADNALEVITDWSAISGTTLSSCTRKLGKACPADSRVVCAFNSYYWDSIVAEVAALASGIGAVRIVSASGTGDNVYTTFALAQAAADPGDVVLAYPGAYAEDLTAWDLPIVCAGSVTVQSISFATGGCIVKGLTVNNSGAVALTTPAGASASDGYDLHDCTVASSGDHGRTVNHQGGALRLLGRTVVSLDSTAGASAACETVYHNSGGSLYLAPEASIEADQVADEDTAAVRTVSGKTASFDLAGRLRVSILHDTYTAEAWAVVCPADAASKFVERCDIDVELGGAAPGGTGGAIAVSNTAVVRGGSNKIRVAGFTTNKIYSESWPSAVMMAMDRIDIDAADLHALAGDQRHALFFDAINRLHLMGVPLEIYTDEGGGGTGNIKTSGSSTTVTSVVASSGQFRDLVVGAKIVANSLTRYITAKASDDSITVDSAVDWDNGGAGYAFGAQNPKLRIESGVARYLYVSPTGMLSLRNHGDANAAEIRGFVTDLTDDDDERCPTVAAVVAALGALSPAAVGAGLPDHLDSPFAEQSDPDSPGMVLKVSIPASLDYAGLAMGRPVPYAAVDSDPGVTLDGPREIVIDISDGSVNGIAYAALHSSWQGDDPEITAGNAAILLLQREIATGKITIKKGGEVGSGSDSVISTSGREGQDTLPVGLGYLAGPGITNNKGSSVLLRFTNIPLEMNAGDTFQASLAIFGESGGKPNHADIKWQSVSDKTVTGAYNGDYTDEWTEAERTTDDGTPYSVPDGVTVFPGLIITSCLSGPKIDFIKAAQTTIGTGFTIFGDYEYWYMYTPGYGGTVFVEDAGVDGCLRVDIDWLFGDPLVPTPDAGHEPICQIGSIDDPVSGTDTDKLVRESFDDVTGNTVSGMAADEAPFCVFPAAKKQRVYASATIPDTQPIPVPPRGVDYLFIEGDGGPVTAGNDNSAYGGGDRNAIEAGYHFGQELYLVGADDTNTVHFDGKPGAMLSLRDDVPITLRSGDWLRVRAGISGWTEIDRQQVCVATLIEQTSDPDDPPDGRAVLWIDTAGDLKIKITHGAVTKSAILADFSGM